MPKPSPRYRARLNAHAYTVTHEEGALHLDGSPRHADLRRISGHSYLLDLDGRMHRVTLEGRDGNALTLRVDGTRLTVDVSDAQQLLLESFGMGSGAGAAQREVKAPMPGLVLALRVSAGDVVEAGQGLVVLEAMKMENEIRASHGGTIARVHVAPGAAVTKGALLLELEA